MWVKKTKRYNYKTYLHDVKLFGSDSFLERVKLESCLAQIFDLVTRFRVCLNKQLFFSLISCCPLLPSLSPYQTLFFPCSNSFLSFLLPFLPPSFPLSLISRLFQLGSSFSSRFSTLPLLRCVTWWLVVVHGGCCIAAAKRYVNFQSSLDRRTESAAAAAAVLL
jgi:hypothetical protein